MRSVAPQAMLQRAIDCMPVSYCASASTRLMIAGKSLIMWSTQHIESVSERDIDLLLLEELNVNESFRRWFIAKTLGLSHSNFGFVGAYHSIIDAAYGESDIVVGFRQTNGSHLAVLAENKIDADFQPRQAERYRHRGQSGIDDGTWSSFLTCLIAPQDFLDTRSEKLDSIATARTRLWRLGSSRPTQTPTVSSIRPACFASPSNGAVAATCRKSTRPSPPSGTTTGNMLRSNFHALKWPAPVQSQPTHIGLYSDPSSCLLEHGFFTSGVTVVWILNSPGSLTWKRKSANA